MTLEEVASKRIENVLVKDKNQNPKHIIPPLKSDLICLLENYLAISNLSVELTPNEKGFSLSINGQANQLKNIKVIA